MNNITPSRVLPNWAIKELGRASKDFDIKIAVRPLGGDCPQVMIDINDGGFQFVVAMRDDWEDLLHLGEDDLWDILNDERYAGFTNE